MKNIRVITTVLGGIFFTHLSQGKEWRCVIQSLSHSMKGFNNYGINDTKQNDANTAVSRYYKHKEDIAQCLYRVRVKYRPLCQNTSLSKAGPLLLGEWDKQLIITHCTWTDVVCNFHSLANVLLCLKCILLCYLNTG